MSTANSTIVGNATIYGVDGTIKNGVIWLGTTNYIQSVNLTDDVDTTEARDQKGNVFGYNLYNFRRAIITIDQDTEAGDSLPVVLVGTWNYIGGGSISGSNTDLMRMSLPCSRYSSDTAGDTVALQTFSH